MDLAKEHLDIGLYTNSKEEMLNFWQDVIGLPFDHMGKLGGGIHQHRHFLGDGPKGPILKINHARDPLPTPGPSGYHILIIAKPSILMPTDFVDPDGNQVKLVPIGYNSVTDTGIHMQVRSLSEFKSFYGGILGLPEIDTDASAAYRCRKSVILAEENENLHLPDIQIAQGYRYITAQIFKADAEHQHVLESGGTEGKPPCTLGDTVRYSFIRDFDGNWIELSQRATLTGSLEEQSS